MPIGKLITREQHDEMLRLHKEGMHYTEIAKLIGCHAITVKYHIRGLAGKRFDGRTRKHPKPRLYDPEFRKKVVELYDSGVYINQICEQLDYTQPSARRILIEEGRIIGRHRRWGEGRAPVRVNGNGYRELFMPDHPNANENGYVLEHVYKAVKALGRLLDKNSECVHHINGDPLDNRNENLLICSRKYHAWLHWDMSLRFQREHFGVQTPAVAQESLSA